MLFNPWTTRHNFIQDCAVTGSRLRYFMPELLAISSKLVSASADGIVDYKYLLPRGRIVCNAEGTTLELYEWPLCTLSSDVRYLIPVVINDIYFTGLTSREDHQPVSSDLIPRSHANWHVAGRIYIARLSPSVSLDCPHLGLCFLPTTSKSIHPSDSPNPKLAQMPAPTPDDAPRRVLLCLDIQEGVLSDPPRGVPSADTLRRNLARVLAAARSASHPPLIVHVRNTGDFGDVDEPNTPGWQLVHTPLPHEPVIDKRKNNAFAGTKLGELVSPDAEIVIVGLQSDFSVRASECLLIMPVSLWSPLGISSLSISALGRIKANYAVSLILASASLQRGAGAGKRGALDTWRTRHIEDDIEGELQEAGVHLLDMKDLSAIFDDR
ncbi:Streptothricin hydrolase [Mycena sanguinolenta]|uniref:Streptothricin hydrolase n=1 Tax=Mycena sanguinolenta TaxID=230812 RepID=A0A8H6ZAU3_9AGAR|nr:Streptothricin hydrolase [Mycena sanguinolenta]